MLLTIMAYIVIIISGFLLFLRIFGVFTAETVAKRVWNAIDMINYIFVLIIAVLRVING